MKIKPRNKKLSRLQFERLIAGEWKPMQGDRFRKNGSFRTWVKDGKKWVSDGNATLRAQTWLELAKALSLEI